MCRRSVRTISYDKNDSLQEQLTVDAVELQRLEAVSEQFKRYYLWVILALGLPGNLASLLTFLHMRSLGSCVVYVAVLAVVDSLALVGKLTLLLLQQHHYSFTPESCKALLFLGNAIVIYANWIVVALAAERLFAVCRPLTLSVYWTRSRAAGGLAVLMLTSLLVCVPVVVVSVPTNDTLSCVYAPQHRRTAQAWHWANVTMYGFLPCLSLLAVNVAIISLLRRARRKQLQLCQGRDSSSYCGGSTANRRLTADTQKQASLILLVASFVLIVLTVPRCALLLMQQLWRSQDIVVIARVRILNQVSQKPVDGDSHRLSLLKLLNQKPVDGDNHIANLLNQKSPKV